LGEGLLEKAKRAALEDIVAPTVKRMKGKEPVQYGFMSADVLNKNHPNFGILKK
jgi:hypothetical protein